MKLYQFKASKNNDEPNDSKKQYLCNLCYSISFLLGSIHSFRKESYIESWY